jgi:hypothetical protein
MPLAHIKHDEVAREAFIALRCRRKRAALPAISAQLVRLMMDWM